MHFVLEVPHILDFGSFWKTLARRFLAVEKPKTGPAAIVAVRTARHGAGFPLEVKVKFILCVKYAHFGFYLRN